MAGSTAATPGEYRVTHIAPVAQRAATFEVQVPFATAARGKMDAIASDQSWFMLLSSAAAAMTRATASPWTAPSPAYVTGTTGLGGLPRQPRPRLRHQLQRPLEDMPSSSSWTRPAGVHYATFLGGSDDDRATHRSGQHRPGLRCGRYQLDGLPGQLIPGYDTTYNGGDGTTAFVVRLDKAGTGLRYASSRRHRY